MFLKEEGQRTEEGSRFKAKGLKAVGRKKEFDETIKKGKRVVCNNYVLWYTPAVGDSQLAVIISAKEGSATKRNKARRVVKEAARVNQGKIKTCFRLVVQVKKPLAKSYGEAEKDIINLLKKAKIIESNIN